MKRQAQAARWDKDGRWHITEPYEPTGQDRKRFPVSYPPNDPGPFFIWSAESFCTESEAISALNK